MIRLHNDYNRGACGKILEKLAQINGESYDGVILPPYLSSFCFADYTG